MKKLGVVVSITAGALLMAAAAFAQNEDRQGQGQAVVTALPAHGGEQAGNISLGDLKIKLDGKPGAVTGWTPLRGADSRLELVLLIDGSARVSLGSQLDEITHFIQETPTNTKIAIAYMQGGRAVLASPLSADPALVLRSLRLPGGSAGSNGSPYFCLSDLAQHWPSTDRGARREVVMITDGVDNYEMRYDPSDPYVQAAITDSVRAGLVVYAMYWHDQGRASSSEYESNAGQNLLLEVTQATGGYSYWQGMGNPVSFQSYFEDLRRRLRNQYALSFASQLSGKPGVAFMKLKVGVPSIKIDAPQQVYVNRASAPRQ
jgi:hypothetical protein